MELRVLHYFLAIAKEGNITSAAAKLHVGQPTLSRQIKDLERELGAPLLTRHSHGISLTDEGQLLRRYAEQMIELSDKVESDFKAFKNKPLGDVYIGGAETPQARLLIKAMKTCQAEQPLMCFHYSAGNIGDIASKLDRGLIDFAVLSQPANLTKYESITFPESERWVAYTRKDNPLARKQCVRKEDLLHEPLIMSEQLMRKGADGNNLALWFGDAFDKLNIVATFNLAYTGSLCAREGLGTMITWDRLIEPTAENGLQIVPLDPPTTSLLALAWRKGDEMTRAAAYFLDVLMEAKSQ